MADNSNPAAMIDLDFCRYNVVTDSNEYTSTTVYSRTERDEVVSDLEAQGWTCYMSQVII